MKGQGRAFLRGLAALPLELVRAVLLLAAFASLVLAVMGLAGRLSPVFDVAAHFALPGFYLSLAALIVGWLANRGERRTTVALAAAGLAGWSLLMGPDVAAGLLAKRDKASGEVIRVLQFNLWAPNRDWHGTSDWIRAQNADVLVVEEVSDASGRILKKLADLYPYAHTCTDPTPCSTVILSRVPPIRNGGHLFPNSQSALTWVTLPSPNGPFTVVGVHHSWPYPVADQEGQSAMTAQTLRMFDAESLIVAGDFNSTPWSAALRRQDKRFGLSRRTHALPTYPARVFQRRDVAFPAPLLPIDHLYAGRAWRTVSIERGPRLGSDHYPLLATFRRGG